MGKKFPLEFDFTKSTAQTLINCVSKLPIEGSRANRRDLIIGKSINDVDMEKIIDLIEMTNNKVNLIIDGVDIYQILERSQEILDRVKNPDNFKEESLMLQMINLERSHVVS